MILHQEQHDSMFQDLAGVSQSFGYFPEGSSVDSQVVLSALPVPVVRLEESVQMLAHLSNIPDSSSFPGHRANLVSPKVAGL